MRYFILLALISLAVFSRLIEHPTNVTAIGAVGIFASAYLPKRLAFTIPIAALFISDMLIGIYTILVMVFVYVGFLCSAIIGRWLLWNRVSIFRIILSAFLASFAFFIISNFSMVLAGYYPFTLEGFAECYTLAIPYFKNTLFANLLFSLLLFGSYELVDKFYLKNISVVQ